MENDIKIIIGGRNHSKSFTTGMVPDTKSISTSLQFNFKVIDKASAAINKIADKLHDLNTEDIDYVDVTGEANTEIKKLEQSINVKYKNATTNDENL